MAVQRGAGLRGLNPSPSEKKSSPYLGVSLGFDDIVSEKQCPICLRLHEKALGNKKIGPLDPFTVNYFFCQILTPLPLTEKLDLPLGTICCRRCKHYLD